MPDNLVHSLQDIINTALRIEPTGEVDRYTQRLEQFNSSSSSLLLIDVSGSMGEILEDGRPKIDVLKAALDRPLLTSEKAIAFGSIVTELHSLKFIPRPSGSTALHLAIEWALPQRPRQTLIISDGYPDDRKKSLELVKQLTGIINTLYIGRDNDSIAIAFMQELASIGYGNYSSQDIAKDSSVKKLRSVVQRLLPPTSH